MHSGQELRIGDCYFYSLEKHDFFNIWNLKQFLNRACPKNSVPKFGSGLNLSKLEW